MIAARPSMGKATLVCNIAENVAVKEGKPVALFSLEMSEAELAQRFIASQARINGDKLRKGLVAKRDWPGVVRACNSSTRRRCGSTIRPISGMLELRAKARRLHAQEQSRGGLALVIVDYLQLMRAEDPRQNRVEQVGQMSRGLKILSQELMIPVIGVSQLSRAPEQRPGGKPMLSDLRESGQIEQDVGSGHVHLARGSLQGGLGAPRRGRHHHRQTPPTARSASSTLVFLPHYPKFADMAQGEQPVEQAAGEAPGLIEDEQGSNGAGDDAASASPRISRLASRPRSGRAELRARDLRRLGLDPRARRRRAPLRLPRARAGEGSLARCLIGDPGQVPGRLVRAPAGHLDRRDGRPRGAGLLRRGDRKLAEGRGIWLMGDVGTGKTTLAMLVSKTALEAGRTVAIYSLPKLLARVRRTYDASPGARTPTSSCSSGSPLSTCCTSTISGPRSDPTGCSSSSTRWSTSATRRSARSSCGPPTSTRPISRSRSARGRCRGWSRSRGYAAAVRRRPAGSARVLTAMVSSQSLAEPHQRLAVPGTVIVGVQWGDEGKGKIIDPLAEPLHDVVRFYGGTNAGHTVSRATGRPSTSSPRASSSPARCVIGNGVVIDPTRPARGDPHAPAQAVDVSALRVSANAHLIMPYHVDVRHGGRGESSAAS